VYLSFSEFSFTFTYPRFRLTKYFKRLFHLVLFVFLLFIFTISETIPLLLKVFKKYIVIFCKYVEYDRAVKWRSSVKYVRRMLSPSRCHHFLLLTSLVKWFNTSKNYWRFRLPLGAPLFRFLLLYQQFFHIVFFLFSRLHSLNYFLFSFSHTLPTFISTGCLS
jgi:hypothetical protein